MSTTTETPPETDTRPCELIRWHDAAKTKPDTDAVVVAALDDAHETFAALQWSGFAWHYAGAPEIQPYLPVVSWTLPTHPDEL